MIYREREKRHEYYKLLLVHLKSVKLYNSLFFLSLHKCLDITRFYFDIKSTNKYCLGLREENASKYRKDDLMSFNKQEITMLNRNISSNTILNSRNGCAKSYLSQSYGKTFEILRIFSFVNAWVKQQAQQPLSGYFESICINASFTTYYYKVAKK